MVRVFARAVLATLTPSCAAAEADKDKERYDREVSEWTSRHGVFDNGSLDPGSDDDDLPAPPSPKQRSNARIRGTQLERSFNDDWRDDRCDLRLSAECGVSVFTCVFCAQSTA